MVSCCLQALNWRLAGCFYDWQSCTEAMQQGTFNYQASHGTRVSTKSMARCHSHADGRPEPAAGFMEPPHCAAATPAWAGEQPPRTRVSFLTAVLMTVALTFHSLLEVTGSRTPKDRGQ
jgi:hypothetical protein